MDESEVSRALEGDNDAKAVRAYRALKHNPGAIAFLAATLAPKHKAFDPKELSEAALALREEAEQTLIRRRERIVSSMNYRTLLTLARELSALGPEDQKKKLDDPIAGPVIRRLREIQDASTQKAQRQNKAYVLEALDGANARTELSQPGVPCDLEPALRFAADLAPANCPWTLLEIAFGDFLTIYIGRENVRLETEHEEDLSRDRARVESILKEAAGNSGREDVIREHEQQLEGIDSEFARLEEARAFRRDFQPGRKSPSHLREEAERIYASHWTEPDSVSARSLAWICTEFYSFWSEHGPAYLTRHEKAQQTAKARALKASTSGLKGANKRDRNKWLGRTKTFIDFAREAGGIPVPAKIPEFIAEFAQERTGVRQTTTKKTVQNFFGVLVTIRERDPDEDEISQLLTEAGLPPGLADTFCECRTLLCNSLREESDAKAKKNPKNA